MAIQSLSFSTRGGICPPGTSIPQEFWTHVSESQMVSKKANWRSRTNFLNTRFRWCANRRYESLISSKPIPAHTESYISYLFLIIHALTFKVEAYGPHNQLKANKLSFWTHPISLNTLTKKGLTKFENPYKNKILKKIKLILNLYFLGGKNIYMRRRFNQNFLF